MDELDQLEIGDEIQQVLCTSQVSCNRCDSKLDPIGRSCSNLQVSEQSRVFLSAASTWVDATVGSKAAAIVYEYYIVRLVFVTIADLVAILSTDTVKAKSNGNLKAMLIDAGASFADF